MLFVWLFALVTGWANACLVQPAAATPDPGVQHERVGVGSAHDTAADVGGTREPDPARQACASFCETEQNLFAKAQPSKGDGEPDAAVLPPAAFDGRPAFTPWRTEPRWRPLAVPPPPGPPAAIAFLRLTL